MRIGIVSGSMTESLVYATEHEEAGVVFVDIQCQNDITKDRLDKVVAIGQYWNDKKKVLLLKYAELRIKKQEGIKA